MADERTYGFNKDDATSLLQSIGVSETSYAEIKPRGGRPNLGDFIAFQPQDVCAGIGFTCDCVEAEVIEVVCGSTTNVGDIVNVWDRNRSKFNMPPELLYASIGYARYVKVTPEEAAELPEEIGPCRWSVIIMDCVEETP